MQNQPTNNSSKATIALMPLAAKVCTLGLVLALSGCLQRSASSFLPASLVATMKQEKAQAAPPKTIEDILREANGGKVEANVTQSVMTKNQKQGAINNQEIAGVDNTAVGSIVVMPSERPEKFRPRNENGMLPRYKSVAADGLPSNAAIAKDWVESGPSDLEGLPMDEINEIDGELEADALFAEYMANQQAHDQVERGNSEQMDDLQLTNASNTTPQLSAGELLAQSKALTNTSTQAANKPTDAKGMFAKAKSLMSGGSKPKKSNAQLQTSTLPTQSSNIVLSFEGTETALSKTDKNRLKALSLMGAQPVAIKAGLSSEGSALEKLQLAQKRMAATAASSKSLKDLERSIDPALPANTILIVTTRKAKS